MHKIISHSRLLFVKQIQVVCSSNGQNIVPRMPLSMKDLPVEIQVVYTHFVLAFPSRRGYLLVTKDPTKCCHISRGFIAVVLVGLTVKDSKEVIIGSSDYFTNYEN